MWYYNSNFFFNITNDESYNHFYRAIVEKYPDEPDKILDFIVRNTGDDGIRTIIESVDSEMKKSDFFIFNNDDLVSLIKTMNFWDYLGGIPFEIFEYAYLNNDYVRPKLDGHGDILDILDAISKTFTLDDLAKFDNVDLFKFLSTKSEFKDQICYFIAGKGMIEGLIYAYGIGCPLKDWVTGKAAENGHLDCLKFLHEHGCKWGSGTTDKAACNGHLDCLVYAHKNGCKLYNQTIYGIVRNGHLNCLIYFHENGVPWDDITTYIAAKYNHLDCLIYAVENGCPFEEMTATVAAINGNLECLMYALEKGCIWKKMTIILPLDHEDKDYYTCLDPDQDLILYIYEFGERLPKPVNVLEKVKDQPHIYEYLSKLNL